MRVTAAIAIACLLAATPALAQPGATNPPPPPPPPTAAPAPSPPPAGYAPPPPVYMQPQTYTYRYGSKIALVDGLSMAALVIGSIYLIGAVLDDGEDDDAEGTLAVALMVGGGIGLFFGGPYVHVSEDNSSSAWKSLGLRIGIPLLGGLISSQMEYTECDGDVCTTRSGNPTIQGLTSLSFLAGMILDWTLFSRVTRPMPPPRYQPYAARTSGGGMTAGLSVSF